MAVVGPPAVLRRPQRRHDGTLVIDAVFHAALIEQAPQFIGRCHFSPFHNFSSKHPHAPSNARLCINRSKYPDSALSGARDALGVFGVVVHELRYLPRVVRD